MYHGPRGLTRIALRANYMARLLAAHVDCESKSFFDTVVVKVSSAEAVRSRASAKRINLRYLDGARVAVSFDEPTSLEDVADVAEAISGKKPGARRIWASSRLRSLRQLRRSDAVLSHPVFNRHHTETEMMRYLKRLENRDLSLVHAMIPLGSCTMKLNAAAELLPMSWPRFAALHPFAPAEQVRGHAGDDPRAGGHARPKSPASPRVSLQPNSGAQGEYAGLLAIRNYLAAQGRGRARRLPDPGLGARHQPGQRADDGPAHRRRRLRRRTATSTWRTSSARSPSTARGLPRS